MMDIHPVIGVGIAAGIAVFGGLVALALTKGIFRTFGAKDGEKGIESEKNRAMRKYMKHRMG